MLLCLQKQSARLRALRLRRGTAPSRSSSRTLRCGGDLSMPPQHVQQRSRAGAGSKRSHSDTDVQHPGSSCSALDVAALDSHSSSQVGEHLAATPSAAAPDSRSPGGVSRAGVASAGANGGDTHSAAQEPADLGAARDLASRHDEAAQLQSRPGGSVPLHDAHPTADAVSHGSREQSTHVDVPEPGVASALRDLTEQVQSLRTSAAGTQQEARRAEKAVGCCALEPATLPPFPPTLMHILAPACSMSSLHSHKSQALLLHDVTSFMIPQRPLMHYPAA